MGSPSVPSTDTAPSRELEPIEAATSDAAAMRRTTITEADEIWDGLAGPLSSATMRLRSLRSRYAAGTAEARELDALIVEIDRAFGAVMRAPPSRPQAGDPTVPRGISARLRPARACGSGTAGSDVAVEARCEAFHRWVDGQCTGPPPVSGDDTGGTAEGLLELLSTVALSLPYETARSLGLPPSTTHARAARLLLWARHAPGGPCCRSFRSARYFLRDAEPDGLPATTPP